MSVSMEGHISWVGEILREKQPQKVLDIGVGMGLYGVLTRQLCDWIRENGYKKENWKVKLVGIEAYESYIQTHQKYIYDNIIIGDISDNDILNATEKEGPYDIVLMIDVLEHLDYEMAKITVNRLKKFCKFIIISTPGGYFEQGSFNDNIYETHKSGWVNSILENPESLKINHKLSDLGNIIKEDVKFPCAVVLIKGDLE